MDLDFFNVVEGRVKDILNLDGVMEIDYGFDKSLVDDLYREGRKKYGLDITDKMVEESSAELGFKK